MYETLTQSLYNFHQDPDDYATWHRESHAGTEDDPMTMTMVTYAPEIRSLIKAVYAFIQDHPEMELEDYYSILQEAGISWNTMSMRQADPQKLDGRTVMALLVGAVQGDAVDPGSLMDFLRDGTVGRWLERLRKIDEEVLMK